MSMIAISKSYEEGEVAEVSGETGRDVDMLLLASDGGMSDGMRDGKVSDGHAALEFSDALAFQATYASAKSAMNGLQFACNWAKRSR
jgi:hypothetical protein